MAGQLEEIHKKGPYRDMKLDNILINYHPKWEKIEARITDLSSLNSLNRFVGTAVYMDPTLLIENTGPQICPERAKQADIYSLGMSMLVALNEDLEPIQQYIDNIKNINNLEPQEVQKLKNFMLGLNVRLGFYGRKYRVSDSRQWDFVKLAFEMIQPEPKNRPDAKTVRDKLAGIKA